MNAAEIRAMVDRLETKSALAAEEAWQSLKPLGQGVAPYLLEAFSRFRTSQGRVSLVYHSTRFARVSEEAFRLGEAATSDRARIVRYRACGLLAYSLRRDALPIQRTVAAHTDPETEADAVEAIDAIESENHHYFIDRSHSGRSHWVVNEGDRPDQNFGTANVGPGLANK
jgi:hypothetical protein